MSVPTLPPLPASLDAHFPVLLLPVSVQVKFVEPTPGTYELRVRIYPDQLAISTHEAALTAAEHAAGVQYWDQAPAAPTATGLHDLAHWRALVACFGVPRSGWILRQTVPAGYRDQVPNLPEEPLLPPADTRWTRAAEARGLPHHFSVLLYAKATSLSEVAEGPVKNLLYAARPYDAPAVPRPTTEFLRLAKVAEGNQVTQQGLAVGLDPQADHALADIGGVDAGNKWTVDFDEAVTTGMAVRVALSPAEYEQGFARLVVLGVRADGAAAGQQALATLFADHCYTDGLHLVPQGTPTNNTDAVAAGYSSRERADADASFDLLAQPARFAAATPWEQRPDGQHLASALGLADGAVPPLAGAGAYDVGEAQALNRALWPATYGYFLEEMLRPLLSSEALTWTRTFFETYVLGRGVVPALRVGAQPYGVLPTTRFSAWEVDPGRSDHAYATQLQGVLGQLDAAWTERLNPQKDLYPTWPLQVAAGSATASFPGPPSDGTNLLTTLGLDATSTEYYQRYLIGPVMAEALNADAQANGTGTPGQIWADAARANGHYDPTQNPLYQEFAKLLDPANAAGLQRTAGGGPAAAPPVFGYTFQSTFMKLADAFADEPGPRRKEGVLLDDEPLSETAPVAAFQGVTTSQNYISWLATASFDDIRLENFTGILSKNPQAAAAFVPPNALFYHLLRQAVLLEYWTAAKAYFAVHGPTLSPSDLADDELFNILNPNEKPRWAWLYDVANGQELHEVLRATGTPLAAYLAGVKQLATLPTARLERLLAEHLDLGSYRLDAWRLAPVAERLADLRQTTSTGSHLGAFGWLEDLKPADRSLANAAGTRDDPDNLGYIHAPSPTHGTAAAILRQGYKSRQVAADAADPTARRMAVDLSSRRVRAALALLEGLRGGLSLGTLLGQSFERALQQHEGLASNGQLYGSFVGPFRAAFPLADEYAPAPGAGQAAPQGLPPEQAARQVTDGAALLRAAATRKTYPYGVDVPSAAADPALAAFVVAQVAQLTDDLDALGDLAVSEGIYQAARGNTDRAAAVLESVAKGQFAVQPDIVHPPQRSLTLTQRVLVQLPVAATLQNWPATPTPRAAAAPRLNAWLAQFFPNPNQVSLAVGYRRSSGDWLPQNAATATLFAMRLQPIDLLYLLDEKALQENSPLDRLLVYAVGQSTALPSTGALPSDARLAVNYASGAGGAALRRLFPLLARLRQLVGGTRPARLRDLQAPGGLTDSNEDAGINHDDLVARLTASQAALATLVPTIPTTAPLALADFYQAALFGIPEAFSALAPGADLNSATLAVRQAVRTRLAVAAVATQPIAPATAMTVAACLEQAAALFGPAFRPDVQFAFGDPVAKQQYVTATAAATATNLLSHHVAQPLALLEWVHGLGAVREPMNQLDKVLLIQNLLHPDAAPLPLRPAQFSAVPPVPNQPDYWLGLSWPRTYAPPGDALSLVQWLPDAYDPAGAQCALWLDEWTETLPQATPATPQDPAQDPPQGTQSTSLAFHYDQPNSEAPQTMLLVVSPRSNPTTWTIDDLLGAVNETLDLAKKRTVEPDALAFTPLATVLPAVIAPVAQQAVTFTLDLGRTNGTARFNEEPLLV